MMDTTEQFSLEQDEKDYIDSRVMAARIAHSIIKQQGPSRHLPESFPGTALSMAIKSLSKMKDRQSELGVAEGVVRRSELKIKIALKEINKNELET